MGKTDFAVFVGRFQPVHRAHLQIMEDALKEADRLIIVIGSSTSPRSLKNPWSFDQRAQMIQAALPMELVKRTTIVPLRDFLYSDTHWAVGLQNAVRRITKPNSTIKLFGHFKDDSSRYLEWFPQWQLVSVQGQAGVNSRDIRATYFSNSEPWETIHRAKLHETTVKALSDFIDDDLYTDLCREAKFLKEYRKKWESAPFPPVFVTTDAVIVKGGHVLLIRRKLNPGKGKLALPGGFVKSDKSVLESALDEVKEETEILFPRDQLKSSIVSKALFDHPERDMRGRVITHAFYIKLSAEGSLPLVNGADDAAEALWMPLAELPLHEENFYSDHFHIIDSFIHGDGADR